VAAGPVRAADVAAGGEPRHLVRPDAVRHPQTGTIGGTGWQGTVSLWRSAADLTAFAYRQPEHRAVIERTPADRWYAEDLFARFAVLDVGGDRDVLGWREGGQADR
jgi:hypothetical protein